MASSGRVDSVIAAEIITAARQCVGTPFRHQGRSLDTGLDCAGVALHVANVVGRDALDVTGYGRAPANGQLESALDIQPGLVRVLDIAARQPGDLLLMRFAREPQHLAVLVGENIVHAYANAGRCVEHRLDDAWSRRIVRVYRFAGVAA